MILTDLIPIKLNSMENDEYKAIGWGSSETNSWYFAFDGIKVTNDNHIHSTPAINAWVGVQFKKEKKKLNLIRIYPRQNLPNDVWRTFTIQGSDNGVEWIDIKKFSNVSFQNNIPQDFELYENNSQYFYYRLFGNENSPRGYLGISEIEMFTKSPANKSLILSNGESKKWKKTIEEIPETWTDDTITFVPNMEANSSLGHIAFASSAYSNGNGAYQAFNETSGSYYSSNSKTGYVGIILNTPKKLFRYKITSVNPTGMLPTNFRILGSNDTTDGSDGTWDLLDNRIGIIFSSTTEVKTFELNETTKPYKSYKLFCDNMKNSSYTRWSLGRIELLQPKEKLTDYSPVIPAHWSTISNTLPNLTQFLEQGMDNLSPLLDRKVTTFKPMPMINKSEILGVGEIGKVFSKTIDLKKYFDIRSMKVEVK